MQNVQFSQKPKSRHTPARQRLQTDHCAIVSWFQRLTRFGITAHSRDHCRRCATAVIGAIAWIFCGFSTSCPSGFTRQDIIGQRQTEQHHGTMDAIGTSKDAQKKITARKNGTQGASSTANTPGPVRNPRTVSRSRNPRHRGRGHLDCRSACARYY